MKKTEYGENILSKNMISSSDSLETLRALISDLGLEIEDVTTL